MIVVLCANPALDVTYGVPLLRPGQTHTVSSVQVRPGGKGTNVARVLQQLGVPVTLVAPLGGASGTAFRDAFDHVALVAPAITGSTRTCVAVVDHDATVFNERGPQVTPHEWESVVAAVDSALSGGDVLVLSGSVPPGVPSEAYADLVSLAHGHGARTIVDAHSAVLDRALAASPDVVAPNLAEAVALVGEHDAATCARLLCERGAAAAVVSAGRDGAFARIGDRSWSVAPPRLLAGNPTGAGDALTAALAAGLHAGRDWPDTLRDAVACAGAAVASPVAGELDPVLRATLLADAVAERH